MRRPPAGAVALALCALAATLSIGGCHRDACVSTCERQARALGCTHPESCRDSCHKLHTSPTCGPELRVFEVCFLQAPAQALECDVDGLPAAKPDTCEAEKAAVMACLERSPTPPSKP
jgi:hypothetical protein